MPTGRGRFIAGALCPACGEMDRLLIEPLPGAAEPDARRRRCVACGYVDTHASTTSQPPTTRLDGALGDGRDEPVKPVRILKPDDD